MTFTVISSAVGAPVTINDDSTLLLTAFGSIIPAAGTGPAISGTFGNSNGIIVLIDGLVAAFRDDGLSRTAVSLSSDNALGNGMGANTVSVGLSGVIRASGLGVGFLGAYNEFTNLGLIEAATAVSANGDHGVFNNGGTIQARICLGLTGYSTMVNNSGSLFAIVAGVTVAGDYADIRNSGIIEAGEVGISVGGSFASVVNSGQVTATQAGSTGLFVIGLSANVINTGAIFGDNEGVALVVGVQGGGSYGLTNGSTGTISGDDYGIRIRQNGNPSPNDVARIDNFGTITANTTAILGGDLKLSVFNAGSIVASNGPAILTDSDQTARVVNTGTIASLLPANGGATVAIDLGGNLDGGTSELRNFGSVHGDVRMSDGVSIVRNGGLIDGDVFLDNGDDSFVGRGGTISGTVFGEGGKDTLRGGAEDDRLSGGDGSDALFGSGGDDMLSGGSSLDVMTGGTGADQFVFAKAGDAGSGVNADHITDFASGQDIIDFRFLVEGKYIGGGAFSNSAGQVRFTIATGLVECDTDGNGVANLSIFLDNKSALTAADFLL